MIYWRRFFARWPNLLGLTMALAFAVVAVGAPLISPVDPKNPGPFKVVGRFTDQIPRPPGSANGAAVLGTLPGGLDVFHTLVWGTREAMTFGLLVALGAFLFGVLFGAIAGYAGGRVGTLMMRVADAFLTFPPLAGAAFLQQLAGTSVVALGGQYYFNAQQGGSVIFFFDGPLPFLAVLIQHIDPLLISLILFSWMPYARVVNTLVMTLKRAEFVLASQAIGAKPFWVIRKHLLPNAVSPAIVLAARDVSGAVILQATMVIIGLGGNSPWGSLLSIGGNWVVGGLFSFWWVYAPVTIAMILFGVTWNIVGDGLSDALSPHP